MLPFVAEAAVILAMAVAVAVVNGFCCCCCVVVASMFSIFNFDPNLGLARASLRMVAFRIQILSNFAFCILLSFFFPYRTLSSLTNLPIFIRNHDRNDPTDCHIVLGGVSHCVSSRSASFHECRKSGDSSNDNDDSGPTDRLVRQHQ